MIQHIEAQSNDFKEYSNIVDSINSINSSDIEHVSEQLIYDSQYVCEKNKNFIDSLKEKYVMKAKISQQQFNLFFEEVKNFNTAYPEANLPLIGDILNIYKQAQQYLKLFEAQKTLDNVKQKYQKEYDEYQKYQNK
jgi:hypothetical protein